MLWINGQICKFIAVYMPKMTDISVQLRKILSLSVPLYYVKGLLLQRDEPHHLSFATRLYLFLINTLRMGGVI